MKRTRVRHENVFYVVACASDWLNERLTLRYADTCLMLDACRFSACPRTL